MRYPNILFIIAALRALLGANGAVTGVQKPTLYVFGDSMSDIGIVGSMSYWLVPSYPYWQYRYSSGPVWTEYLALLLDYSQHNMAVGMSAANGTRGWHLPFVPTSILPSTLDQIRSFKKLTTDHVVQAVSTDDIVILEIGSNDYLYMLDEITSGRTSPSEFAHELAADVLQQVKMLKELGFINIVVASLPFLQSMPAVRYMHYESITATVVDNYNRALSQQLQEWLPIAELHSFALIDITKFMELALMPSISGALGLVDTTRPCVGANIFNLLEPSNSMTKGLIKLLTDAQENVQCLDPSTHFFFDIVHLGERVHRLFGYYATEAISAAMDGKPYALTEEKLLRIIRKNNLGTPAPKPASV